MTISINEIESGIGLLIEGQIYLVTDYDHVKPAKGRFVRVRMKNVKTGNVLERTFSHGRKVGRCVSGRTPHAVSLSFWR